MFDAFSPTPLVMYYRSAESVTVYITSSTRKPSASVTSPTYLLNKAGIMTSCNAEVMDSVDTAWRKLRMRTSNLVT